MPTVTKKFSGLKNDVTYYARIYPVNASKGEGYYQSELEGQTASADTFYFPNDPMSYVPMSRHSTSETITIQENGWYQVYVYGASGNGGSISTHIYNQREVCEPLDPDKEQGDVMCHDEYSYNQGAGGGGGGGGYATSKIKMKAGDTITLTVGSPGNDTLATISSSMELYNELRVTSGTNGENGSAGSSGALGGTGGSGGQGSGGNIDNGFGTVGGKGDSVERQDTEDYSRQNATPGSGGNPGIDGGNTGGKGNGEAGKSGFMVLYKGQ